MIKYFTFLILLASYATLTAQTGKFADHEGIIFDYDEAGNQIFRGTGQVTCITCRAAKEPEPTLADIVANNISAAPVPVKDDLTIMWKIAIKDYIISIDLLPYNAFRAIENVNLKSVSTNFYIFKMGNLPYGVYFLKFNLSDGSVYTRTVTKN